jgi:hypothetical protein
MDNHHFAVFGRSGFGKSNFLLQRVRADIIAADRAVVFIDPHGHDCLTLLDTIHKEHSLRLCYLDFSDHNFPVSFNPNPDPDVAVNAFKTRWKEAWSESMEWLFYNALSAVYEANRPISDIPRMFSNTTHRAKIIRKVRTPTIKEFWTKEFPSYSQKQQEERPVAITNRLGQLLTSKVAPFITTTRPTLDLEKAIRQKQVVIVNLAKGHLGKSRALTIGSLFTSCFAHAAFKVQAPVSFYADEFHSYGTDIYETMLSEYRKFGLKLGLVSQFASQLDATLLDAILSNVAELVVFNVSYADARLLAPQFDLPGETDFDDNRPFHPTTLTSLPRYTAVINGTTTSIDPFAPRTTGRLHLNRKASREHFGRSL